MRFIIAFIATVLVLASFTVVITIQSWQDNPFPAEVANAAAGDSQASLDTTGAPYTMAVVNVRNMEQTWKPLPLDGNGSLSGNEPQEHSGSTSSQSPQPDKAQGHAAESIHVADPETASSEIASPTGEGALPSADITVQSLVTTSQPATTLPADPMAQSSSASEQLKAAPVAALSQPALTINGALVNVRAGPDTAYPVLRQATHGQQFAITARNSDHTWWQVCCIQEQSGWVLAELVQTEGVLDIVHVAADIPPPPSPILEAPVALAAIMPASVTDAQNETLTQSTGSCPTQSDRQYTAIDMAGVDYTHADYAHGDLNLTLRGSAPTNAALNLVDISGPADSNAPRLNGLFADGRVPTFTSTHQVYDWNWGCGGDGCRGDLLSKRENTLAGMATAPGEEIHIPTRQQQIFGGGYMAAVLYAEPTRLTLNYTREGTAAVGYTVHLENLCVDPNLLALYRSSNAGGRHQLPALHNGDVVGIAADGELRVSIRDNGEFMDPRSRKDWW
ncbi:MAG: SH3 domain-containing protein [Caldilineaceae bacterium]|nr:SH3 domain-containing protein [Caldilineaceae bacterium]